MDKGYLWYPSRLLHSMWVEEWPYQKVLCKATLLYSPEKYPERNNTCPL